MGFPERLKIGGHWYAIKFPYQFRERFDRYGHHAESLNEIVVADVDPGGCKRAMSRIIVSLIHEVLHAIDSTYGHRIFRGDKGENDLGCLSEGIFQVLVDNGYLTFEDYEEGCDG